MKQKNSLLLAGLFTVLGLGILLKLGFWQLDRLAWKTELLAKIDANMAAAPLTLPENIGAEQLLETMDYGNWEYRQVCVTGEFLHKQELFLFSTNLAGGGGYHVYTPFIRENATTVFINRGWVPNEKVNSATRPEGQLSGIQQVCGIFRGESQTGAFTPENDVNANVWFTRNSSQMAEAAGLKTPFPVFIDADFTPTPGGFPVGGQTKVDLPNNHLGYAITWFGLVVALLGVFTVFALKARKN